MMINFFITMPSESKYQKSAFFRKAALPNQIESFIEKNFDMDRDRTAEMRFIIREFFLQKMIVLALWGYRATTVHIVTDRVPEIRFLSTLSFTSFTHIYLLHYFFHFLGHYAMKTKEFSKRKKKILTIEQSWKMKNWSKGVMAVACCLLCYYRYEITIPPRPFWPRWPRCRHQKYPRQHIIVSQILNKKCNFF